MSRASQTSLLEALRREFRRAIFRSNRDQLDRELAEEMQFHLDLKRQAAGDLGPIEMGNMTLAAEQSRDQWSFMRLERFLQDLRYASRIFFRSPGFTLIAVLSL